MSCPSSIQRHDSYPRPSESESHPITTRPGLSPLIQWRLFFKMKWIKTSNICSFLMMGKSNRVSSVKNASNQKCQSHGHTKKYTLKLKHRWGDWLGRLSREHLLNRNYHCTADLLFILFVFRCIAYGELIQFKLFGQIQTSQTGGEPYSDTSPIVNVLCSWWYKTFFWRKSRSPQNKEIE